MGRVGWGSCKHRGFERHHGLHVALGGQEASEDLKMYVTVFFMETKFM